MGFCQSCIAKNPSKGTIIEPNSDTEELNSRDGAAIFGNLIKEEANAQAYDAKNNNNRQNDIDKNDPDKKNANKTDGSSFDTSDSEVSDDDDDDWYENLSDDSLHEISYGEDVPKDTDFESREKFIKTLVSHYLSMMIDGANLYLNVDTLYKNSNKCDYYDSYMRKVIMNPSYYNFDIYVPKPMLSFFKASEADICEQVKKCQVNSGQEAASQDKNKNEINKNKNEKKKNEKNLKNKSFLSKNILGKSVKNDDELHKNTQVKTKQQQKVSRLSPAGEVTEKEQELINKLENIFQKSKFKLNYNKSLSVGLKSVNPKTL